MAILLRQVFNQRDGDANLTNSPLGVSSFSVRRHPELQSHSDFVDLGLTCAPDTAKVSRSQHASAFELDMGTDQSTLASPTACGYDGWVLDDVTWSCQPERKVVAKNDRK